MAKCKWCGKSGLLLNLSKNGLCNTCENIVISEIVQAQKHINESTEIIQQSSNTDTIVSRFDYIVEKLKTLRIYEEKGIPTLIPPPSKALEAMSQAERDNHIVYGLEKELEKLKSGLVEHKTEKVREDKIQKFRDRTNKFMMEMTDQNLLFDIETELDKLTSCIDTVRYHSVGGEIAFYHLEDWWFTAFTEDERNYIESKLESSGLSITKGKVISYQTKVSFLNGILTWFRRKDDAQIAKRIISELDKVAEEEPVSKPGYYRGRHCSSYPLEIEQFIRTGELGDAEILLYHCVDATEEEAKANGWGVAPWFYDKLALIYRKQKDLQKEYIILERFSKQIHANGVKPPILMERFEKVKALINKTS